MKFTKQINDPTRPTLEYKYFNSITGKQFEIHNSAHNKFHLIVKTVNSWDYVGSFHEIEDAKNYYFSEFEARNVTDSGLDFFGKIRKMFR